MRKAVFGKNSPLHVRGGQLTLNAAIAIDMTDPAQAGRVAERVLELKKELLATGTLHRFTTQAGSVTAGTAERLPAPLIEADEGAANADVATGGGGLVGGE